MGGQNKKTSNTNQKNSTAQKIDLQFAYKIRESFHNCAYNGKLNKDQFNQALLVLESLGYKRLRDTPLADRLFILFDKSNTGYISENQFSSGINEIVLDQNNGIIYSFKAYDINCNNMITKKQFTLFIEESWKNAFRLLSQSIDTTKSPIKIRDIQSWSLSKISALNEQTTKLFNKLDKSKKGFLQFIEFKEFVNSGYTDVIAQIDNNCITIPLTLINLSVKN